MEWQQTDINEAKKSEAEAKRFRGIIDKVRHLDGCDGVVFHASMKEK